MKNLKSLLFTFALVFSFNANASVVGDKAPNFSTKDVNGVEVKLKNLSDKIVVLEWHNAECPFVKKHYDGGNMQALQKQYTEKGVVWISVNSGAKGKQGHFKNNDVAKEALKQKNWSGSNYIIDELGEIGKLYKAATTPHMFIINKGNLVYAGVMPPYKWSNK